MTAFDVFVSGRPAPQGSRRYVGQHGGKGITVESSNAVKPWRQDIREACLVDGQPRVHFDQRVGVSVNLVFVMPRPTSLPKKTTPTHTKRPDIDKLARAVLDAISSAGVWADDSQVVILRQSKRYAELGETPGCHIFLDAVRRSP